MNEPEFPPRRGRPPNISLPNRLPESDATPDESAPTIALEDPRARAARRAFELREHLGDLDQGQDEFHIDPRIVPDGWSYEWKRKTVLMAERDDGANASYMTIVQQRGWEPVPTSRHPHLMPKGHPGNAAIEKKGQILMERPLEITKEIQAQELRKARAQVGQKEAQLNNAPPGTFGRDNKGSPLTNIKKAYGHEPIAVPK